jgi:catechol 2,3-dioxygenase-like lactoylglutathione lyase family enzyme
MQLGAYSISLSVKDIEASKAFYEKLGFMPIGGDISHNWLILKNDDCVIGLFQGMLTGNIITFNPGWDQSANNLEQFQDIRELKEAFESEGIAPIKLDSERESGPASFTISDPDGNMILFDQHR